jgi:predicted NBD/HSP70 family sugar kinase
MAQAVFALRAEAEARNYPVTGIGFCVPHFSEGNEWFQRQTNNVPVLEGFPMFAPLAEVLGPTLAVANDISAAGIAEHLFGKGREAARMLFMAIGTGMATCLITEEGLVQYTWGSTGDTGMIIVDPLGAADCTCGGRGCLEAYAGGWAIRRRALSEIQRGRKTQLADMLAARGNLEAKDVAEAARAGDAVAIDIFEQVGFYLGVAFSSFLHIYMPTLIVLGGGVSQAGDLFMDPMHRTMNRLASPWFLARLTGIELSALGKDGGMIGAAAIILYPGKYLPIEQH